MCSISRIHVVWKTSAASLSTSLKSLVIDQMSRPYLSTRPSQARGSPLAALRISLVASRSATSAPATRGCSTANPSSTDSAIAVLVSTDPPEDHRERLPQDLQIENERPVLDVPQVQPHRFVP